MITLHLEKNDFGKDIKRTIKIRHYVNLIGWQVFNSFIFVSAIAAKSDINPTGKHTILKAL